ncbi:MAG: AbrB family transcriptional regulator [Rhizobiaceae bacterium]|nr:AbrB family transcriptional regulator [Rhizobiaceae bacterium]
MPTKDKAGNLPPLLRFALAMLVGTLGGALFWYLRTPLAWLLGAMTFTMIASLVRAPVATPGVVRLPMTALIGTMLGAGFHPGTFAGIGEWYVPLAGLIVFMTVAAAVSYSYFRRVGGFDRPTAFFSGMPGGLIDMVVMGGERGGDERTIALVHAARIFLVVLILPFAIEIVAGIDLPPGAAVSVPLSALDAETVAWLAGTTVVGYAGGWLLRLPARHLFGPMIASGLVHYFGFSDFAMPAVVIAVAQIVIGATIGSRFSQASPAMVLRILALSVGSAAVLLSVTFAFALALSRLTGIGFAEMVLAYAPGGVVEMSLIALALSGDVAFVAIHHIVRVMLVIAGAIPVYALMARRAPD